jgi:hypothetical protein
VVRTVVRPAQAMVVPVAGLEAAPSSVEGSMGPSEKKASRETTTRPEAVANSCSPDRDVEGSLDQAYHLLQTYSVGGKGTAGGQIAFVKHVDIKHVPRLGVLT